MIPYEDERQKRIEDNTKRMKALNLPNLAQSLVKSSSATKKTSSHLRGTNGGGRTLSSRGRRSTGVVHVTPTLQSPQLSPNQSLVHAQPTPSPHINTSPTPSPHINTTPSQHINTMPTQSLPRNTTPTPSPHINTIPLSSPLPTHTPTPTSTTSSTLPQNSKQTLPHTQSPAIEPDEDEEIDQECLLEIEPYGNEFNPSTAIRFLTKSIKSKFDWFCPTWGHATTNWKELWFTEFKKCCKWEPKYDARIRQIFEIKGECRFRGMMYQERKNYAENSEHKPKYIPGPIWSQLIHHWASDKKFKNLSVANIANRASTQGSSIHTGGSISMGEHERRMEKETGVKPTMDEVFAQCHIKKDKVWVDKRAEQAYGDFKKRKAELLEISMSQDQDESQHNMPDDLTIWKEVVPKGKKGKLYGLGSTGTNSLKYSIGSCSNAFKDKSIEEELLKWKEKAKEQELINQEQKQKLEQQQKRIESNESMLVSLFGKLNMPLPSNFACATPMQDEPNDIVETSNGNNADNFGFD